MAIFITFSNNEFIVGFTSSFQPVVNRLPADVAVCLMNPSVLGCRLGI